MESSSYTKLVSYGLYLLELEKVVEVGISLLSSPLQKENRQSLSFLNTLRIKSRITVYNFFQLSNLERSFSRFSICAFDIFLVDFSIFWCDVFDSSWKEKSYSVKTLWLDFSQYCVAWSEQWLLFQLSLAKKFTLYLCSD